MDVSKADGGLLAELTWRGLVTEASQGVEERLARGPISAYIGFDASARSLHVGHLLQVFMLTHLQRHGAVSTADPGARLPSPSRCSCSR